MVEDMVYDVGLEKIVGYGLKRRWMHEQTGVDWLTVVVRRQDKT